MQELWSAMLYHGPDCVGVYGLIAWVTLLTYPSLCRKTLVFASIAPVLQRTYVKVYFGTKKLCLRVTCLVPKKFALYKLSPKAIVEMSVWIFRVWNFSFAIIIKMCLFIHFVCLCVAEKGTDVP